MGENGYGSASFHTEVAKQGDKYFIYNCVFCPLFFSFV